MSNSEKQDTILQVRHISKTLGDKKILSDCSLDMKKGELKVLIGPSGAGKSTLLQCINCLIMPDEGEITLQGAKLYMQSKRELCAYRTKVGMIFQDFNLFDHLNAIDNVAIALCKVKGIDKKTAHARAMQELERVGLDSKARLYPAQLSGGQKQRVAIARALAMDPIVILLDEPTSALDPELVGEVLNVIRELSKAGMTMIMATHQMEFARAVANEIVFMEKGVIIEHGTPAELLAEGAKTRTRDFCTTLLSMESPVPLPQPLPHPCIPTPPPPGGLQNTHFRKDGFVSCPLILSGVTSGLNPSRPSYS